MMDTYRVSYSPAARDDLKAIYTYIARDLQAAQTAKRQTERIRREIRTLDTFPERCSLVAWEPWASMKMHKMPVDHYVVYYSVNTEKRLVTIVRIFYGGRDVAGIIQNLSE